MMEAREYASYQVVAGDGDVAIATLAHNEWVPFVNSQLSKENKNGTQHLQCVKYTILQGEAISQEVLP